MTIRKGVKWTDGTTLKPRDVKYSFDLAKIATHPQRPLWASTGLQSRASRASTVVFTFAESPATSSSTSIATTSRSFRSTSSASTRRRRSRPATSRAGKVVGTGPYKYQSGVGSTVPDVRLAEATTGGRRRPSGSTPRRVRRGHPQLVEHGRARQLPGGEHRPLQQLRPEVGDQEERQDLLRQGAVPPRSEHDVALPEHDEEAAERSAVPPALLPSRST